MKKIILLGIFVLSAISSYSQCPTPLSWDYPNIPYIQSNSYQAVVINENPLCIMKYDFCYRTTPCCFDFAITNIEFEGDCSLYIKTLPLNTLIRMATFDLITNVNPWNASSIPECPDLSEPFWKQATTVCWSEWYWDHLSGTWKRSPCPDDGEERWCWIYYRCCWEFDSTTGNRVLHTYESHRYTGGPPCDPWGELECYSRCN